MESVIYRKGREKDIVELSEQIAVSYKAVYHGHMCGEYLNAIADDHWVPILRRTLSEGGACMLAEKQGRVVGSAVFGKAARRKYQRYAELYAIYLLPQYVGCGVGHGLYSKTEQEMVIQNYTGCILEVLSQNVRAIKFYVSHGFEETRTFTVHENGMTLCCTAMRKAFF